MVALLVAVLVLPVEEPQTIKAPPNPPKPQPLLDVGWGGRHLRVDGWEGLDHWAEGRWRAESWSHLEKSGQDGRYDYTQFRFRQGLSQNLGLLEVGFEWQSVNLFGVDPDAPIGPGRNYLDANGNGSPQSLSVRQLYAEVDAASSFVRVGRQLYEDNAGLKYDDPAFQYVRDRGNARMLGNCDWSAAGRSFDGASIRREDASWLARGFGFEANQGTFDVNDAGDSLEDVRVAGVELVSKVGTLVPNTELRAFGFSFHDARAVTESKFGDELLVDVVGAQIATRGRAGPGTADLWLWGAHESGEAGSRSLRAGAWIAETGYRFDDVTLSPWLRVGHARAQGDSNPTDGAVHDFYNGLPTNHTYYGYADLFAFSNLRNTYVDLLLDLHPQARFVATFHAFALNHAGAGVASGSGAFNKKSYGYATLATTSRNLGHELDLTLRLSTPGKRAWTLLGYSYFWGGTAYERLFAEANVGFAYLEVGFRF